MKSRATRGAFVSAFALGMAVMTPAGVQAAEAGNLGYVHHYASGPDVVLGSLAGMLAAPFVDPAGSVTGWGWLVGCALEMPHATGSCTF